MPEVGDNKRGNNKRRRISREHVDDHYAYHCDKAEQYYRASYDEVLYHWLLLDTFDIYVDFVGNIRHSLTVHLSTL